MKMIRTHKHYCFPIKHKILEHQLLIFYHMSLYIQEGIQRVRFLTHKTIQSKLWLLILEFFIDPLVCQCNMFCQYNEKFSFEKKISIPYLMKYLSTLCVTTIVYCNFPYASVWVTWKFFIFTLFFARLIRGFRKVAPSDDFIPSNHSSSMTTTFSRNF